MNYFIILSYFFTTLITLNPIYASQTPATPYAAFLKKKSIVDAKPTHEPVKTNKYNLQHISRKQSAQNVVHLLQTMIEPYPAEPVINQKQPVIPPKKPAKLPYNLNITAIEEPLNLLITFETKEALNATIKTARQQFAIIAKVLQIAVTLLDHNQLQDLSVYLQHNMNNFPAHLVSKSPEHIIAYYISKCYNLLVEDHVTGWTHKQPQIFIKPDLQAQFSTQDELLTLQVIELLAKFDPLWDFCAKIFFNDTRTTQVQLEYPNATLSINNWADITQNKALDLYNKTSTGNMEDLAHKQAQEEKRQKDMRDLSNYKEKTLQAFKDHTKKMEAQHLARLDQELKTHAFNMKLEQIEEQATELQLLEVTLTEPQLQLVNDTLDTALDACQEMTDENIAQAHKTVLSNLTTAYEWLLEPKETKSPFDQDIFHDDYDEYLHLQHKFNQHKLYPQLKYILRKLVYTWNVYCFAGYAGKQESIVTLKFSAKNIKKNSISDWLKFTKSAGFTYSGQFEKIEGQPTPTSTLQKLFNAYKWLRLKMKATPKKATPEQIKEQQDFIIEVKNETQNLIDQEKAERAKLFELFKQEEERLKNPKAITPKTPPATTSPATVVEEPIAVKEEPAPKASAKATAFDADFVKALRAARLNKK